MKLLVVDQFHPDALAALAYGHISYDEFSGSREDFLRIVPEYDGLLIRSRFSIDREVIDAGKKLRLIGRAGAGMENIDTVYAASKGISCFNSPEGNRDSVGEHAIGMLLMLLNHLKRADTEMRSGTWARNANWGTEIMGKTIGIIGYGNTGSRLARKLSGFDCTVLAYDKYKTGFGNEDVQEATMEMIFEQADVLSLHVPLTQETRYLVCDEYLGQFRKSPVLINTSRGPVVETEAVVRALRNGVLKGACLDVLEYEELGFETIAGELPEAMRYLMNSDKVVLTPHIAGWTHEGFRKISVYLVEKVLEYIERR